MTVASLMARTSSVVVVAKPTGNSSGPLERQYSPCLTGWRVLNWTEGLALWGFFALFGGAGAPPREPV